MAVRTPLRRLIYCALVGMTALLLSLLSVAQEEIEQKTLQAERAAGPITIDGSLSEPDWDRAPVGGGFTQRHPDPGAPPTRETEIRVLYDEKTLYIGAVCHDPEPEMIDLTMSRRDRFVPMDVIGIYIDSRFNRREAYAFELSAAGTRVDSAIYNETHWNTEWDALWEAKTTVTEEGWIAEMAIPFSELRFSAGEEVRFGFQVERWTNRLQESDMWVYVPPGINRFVSAFGTLEGIRDIRPGTGIEFTPFAVLKSRFHTRSPYYDRGLSFDAGLDFNIPLGSGFTATGTLNPDFGQVEQDEVVLNLSTYETFYPEKRPFFLEGFQIFTPPTIGRHGMTLLHTRRIGAPPYPPDEPEGGGILEAPETTTILGAAKVTGTTRGRFTLGAFSAVTRNERATLVDSEGNLYEEVTAPQTVYSVLRAQQGFGSNSSVGFLGTHMDRQDGRTASVGALTWDLHFRDNKHIFQGNLVGSWVDDENLDPERSDGVGLEVGYEHRFNDNWRGEAWLVHHGENLQVNDMGYLRRNSNTRFNGWLLRRWNEPTERFIWKQVTFESWYAANLDGKVLTRGGNIGFNSKFQNHWGLWGGMTLELPFYDDREARSEGVLFYNHKPEPHFWVGLRTDERKPLHWQFGVNLDKTYNGWRRSLNVETLFQPTDRVNLSAELTYTHRDGNFRWVDSVEDDAGKENIIFADLNNRTYNLLVRASYTFTPDLTLDLYTQIFDTAGHYTNFQKLWSATNFTLFPYEGNPDFHFAAWNLNLVGRWEFKPGCTAFAVFSHGQQGSAEIPHHRNGPGMSPRRDLTLLTSSPRDDLVLLKVSYRF